MAPAKSDTNGLFWGTIHRFITMIKSPCVAMEPPPGSTTPPPLSRSVRTGTAPPPAVPARPVPPRRTHRQPTTPPQTTPTKANDLHPRRSRTILKRNRPHPAHLLPPSASPPTAAGSPAGAPARRQGADVLAFQIPKERDPIFRMPVMSPHRRSALLPRERCSRVTRPERTPLTRPNTSSGKLHETRKGARCTGPGPHGRFRHPAHHSKPHRASPPPPSAPYPRRRPPPGPWPSLPTHPETGPATPQADRHTNQAPDPAPDPERNGVIDADPAGRARPCRVSCRGPVIKGISGDRGGTRQRAYRGELGMRKPGDGEDTGHFKVTFGR